MDRDSLIHALRATFADELTQQLQLLNTELVALEQAKPQERQELVRSLFRRAHGLKGAARAADLEPVEETCHAMEALLGLVREGSRALDPSDYEALFAALDALEGVARNLAGDPAELGDPAALMAARAVLTVRAHASPPGVSPSESDAGENPIAEEQAPLPEPDSRPSAASQGGPTSDVPGPSEDSPPPALELEAPATRPSPEEPASVPGSPGEPAASAPPAAAAQIRISAARLDSLSAAGGELLPFIQHLAQQSEALEALAQELRALRRRTSSEDGSAEAAALDDHPSMTRLERRVLRLANQAADDERALGQVVRRLRADIRELRLVPWAEATAGLGRHARDNLKGQSEKSVKIEVEDSGLELDQSLVAVLRELLPQLVQNAIDHGIEPSVERAASGKSPQGTVRIRAAMDHDIVEVDVEDDGRGLDPAKLAAEAQRRGLPIPRRSERMLELIFHPGFSTAASVTTTSGRGVGLDLVASRVRAANGRLTVASTPGQGTRFRMKLPASLSLIRGLLVRAQGEIFTLPALSVERVSRPRRLELKSGGGRELLGESAAVPVARLADVLELPRRDVPTPTPVAVLIRAGKRRCALLVEEALAEQELVLQPLVPGIGDLPAVTAVASLTGGELALLLDPEALVDGVLGATGRTETEGVEPVPAAARRILLVDDSATTRTLERSILAAAGYEVLTAVDGEQAWGLLQEQAPDLVISDVEMPRMNGFELTRTIRQSHRFAKLPVILLTGRKTEADQRKGLEAGANAYLVKSNFDQRALLETVSELL